MFEQLDRSIAELHSGFILFEGHPGTGKSTTLTMYQRQRENVRFAYYCFIPNEKILGHPRLERDTFLKSLCIGIQNSFPEVEFPQIYSQEYQNKLQKYLDKLSQLGTKVVFIIDGLDHVDNKKEKLEYPLTHYLEGTLPDNIIFILSSQYPEAISDEIQTQIKLNPLRHIKVERFSIPEVEDFLQRRKIHLSVNELSIVAEKSEGIPLYLYYIAQLLLEGNARQYARILNELPSLKNEKIDFYHNFLYNHISRNSLAVWTLAILAHREEYTTTAIVVELLTLLNVSCDSNQIEEVLRIFKHLLKLSDSNSYTIFHNSFREFILDKTNHLTDDINAALIRYYKNNPHSDETYRNFYRHLFEIGNYQEISINCNEKWLEQSWKLFRPFDEISLNLDLAWEASIQIDSLKEFIRIAFLKQEFGTVERNFERAEFNLSHFLLEIGKTKDAVRSVWDGERVNYTLVEFSEFVLEYYKRTGHLIPEKIANSSLHKPIKGMSADDLGQYYQAVAFYKNWSILFDEINSYRWHHKDEHNYTVKWRTEEENNKINNSIKEKVIESLYIAKKYESLLSINKNSEVSQQIKNQALLYTIFIFIAEEEIDEATSLLEEVDFTQLKHENYNQLFILFAEKGYLDNLQGKVNVNYLPPTLFYNLTNKDINGGIKKELLTFYDELRVHFTQNPDGYRLFAIKASTFNMPEQGFFLALIELAQLWCDTLNKQLSKLELAKRAKRIFDYLNIDKSLRHGTFHTSINDAYYIDRDVHKIYSSVFSYIAKFLTSSQIIELVDYWLLLDTSPNGYKNLNINIEFAKIIKARHNEDLGDAIKSLLERAEVQARQDEETSVLVNELLVCAEAYGYCGFEDDAIRLWEELFALGCGIYYRKDYQFNEAIYALRLAHKHHPEKSLERLSTLLTLVHRLEGAAQGRTIARAVEKLITCACELSPEIALELLHREDEYISRESGIQDLVPAFIDLTNTNLWYVWAIVKTMDKWGDYGRYNDYTYPTMLNLFEKVLEAKDTKLIQEIYYFTRHQLLVEQDRPGGVFEFADYCIRFGFQFDTVENDRDNFREAREKEKAAEQERNGLSRINTNNENTELQEIKNLAVHNFDEFIERLEQLRQSHIQASRLSEVKNAYQELKNVFITFYETLSQDTKSIISICRLPIIKYFAKFKKQILELKIFQQQEYRLQVRYIAGQLMDNIGQLTCLDNWEETFNQLFEVDKWIEDFIIKTSQSDYFFNRNISTYFTQIVKLVSLNNLAKLEQLCRKFLLGDDLSKCLVALAKRQHNLKPDYSQKLLIEAWEEKKDFLYLDTDLAKELLSCLFLVNQQAAKTFLLTSFLYQYKIYSKELIYHLDQLIEFANYFDEEQFYDYLYQAYERHNVRLAEGLTEKVNYEWLSNYNYSLSFQESVIQYLVRLLDYPEVEIRKLSLSSLYSLIYYEPLVLSKVIDFCYSESDNIKEHILSLILSIAISNLELVLQHKQSLLKFLDVPHFNIKQTAKEVLLFCIDRGASFESGEIIKVEATNRPPQVFFPYFVDTSLLEGRKFILSKYQSKVLHSLYAHNGNREVIQKVYTRIIRSGWTIKRGMEVESATHMEHNINSNYDSIEINGQYFQAVQSALNEVFNQEIINQSYEEAEIQAIKRQFRLYDPTDIYVQSRRKPEVISWISPEVLDEDFLNFQDVEQRCLEFINREEDWITLYEDGSQRVGDFLERNKKTTYFRVIAFLTSKDDNVVLQAFEETIKPYIKKENYYRFEIPNVFPDGETFPISGIRPIIGISENNFRGQNNLSIASLLPDMIEELGLSRNQSEYLTYSHNNETVVDFSYWQEAFDQSRRRQKPNSAGVTLKVQRHFLQSFLDKNEYQLCFILNLKRSTDKYCSEEDMNWQYFKTTFCIEL